MCSRYVCEYIAGLFGTRVLRRRNSGIGALRGHTQLMQQREICADTAIHSGRPLPRSLTIFLPGYNNLIFTDTTWS